ncbi:hypothetical protein [Desulfotomaculum defluvii]
MDRLRWSGAGRRSLAGLRGSRCCAAWCRCRSVAVVALAAAGRAAARDPGILEQAVANGCCCVLGGCC